MIKDIEKFPGWLEQNWHPLCGLTYLAICVLDFAFMPLLYEVENYQLSASKIVELAIQFKDSSAQVAALNALHATHAWTPITLSQNGFFHVAFGAILGVGIWSKGRQVGNDALTNLTTQIQTIAGNIQNTTTTTTVGTISGNTVVTTTNA